MVNESLISIMRIGGSKLVAWGLFGKEIVDKIWRDRRRGQYKGTRVTI